MFSGKNANASTPVIELPANTARVAYLKSSSDTSSSPPTPSAVAVILPPVLCSKKFNDTGYGLNGVGELVFADDVVAAFHKPSFDESAKEFNVDTCD